MDFDDMEDVISQLKQEITNLQIENHNLKEFNLKLTQENEKLLQKLKEATNNLEKQKENINIINKNNDSKIVMDKILQESKNLIESPIIDLVDVPDSLDEIVCCDSLDSNSKTPKSNNILKVSKRLELSARSKEENKKRLRDEDKEKKRLEQEVLKKTREEERKLKEKEKERKRLELEVLKKAKEEEKKLKEEERKAREEERKAKEEEKERKRLEFEAQKKAKELELEKKRLEEEQRKEQKKRQEEELEEKKRRQSQKFMKFFHKIEKSEGPVFLPTSMCNPRFQPFQIKEGVVLAPILVRKPFTKEEKDFFLCSKDFQIKESNYLSLLEKKAEENKIAKQKKKLSDVEPIKSGSRCAISFVDKRPKMKLFQFFENVRPPYYGTWRRRSTAISGRRPFSTDEKSLNYDYDSEEDWEDEPSDAEECNSNEEDDLKDEEDELEDNDGFFVEHGYLSAGEGSEGFSNDEEEKNERDTSIVSNRKHRLAQRAEEWKNSLKQKHKKYRKCQLNTAIYEPSWKEELEIGQNLPLNFKSMRLSSVIIPYNNLLKSKEVKEDDKLVLKKTQKKTNV